MTSRFERLPMEIQQMVLKCLGSDPSDFNDCVRVCKGWKHIFQNRLYSIVILWDYSQLAEFVDTLKNSQYLSSLVKDLTLNFISNLRSRRRNSNLTNLFTLLPNLESIDCSAGQVYFTFLLEALLENHLPKLNRMAHPMNVKEVREYTTCCILLKDRLRNLELNEGDSGDEYSDYGDDDEEDSDTDDEHSGSEEEDYNEPKKYSLQFDRLYQKLNLFKNLDTLCIRKETDNTINTIEEMIDTFPLLTSLELKSIAKDANQMNTIDNSSAIMASVAPAQNISHLKLHKIQLNNPQHVQYVIYKFPHLVDLQIDGNMFNRGTPDMLLDKAAVSELFNYLTNIKRIKIRHLLWNDQTYINCLEMIIVKLSVLSVELMRGSTYMDLEVNERTGKVWISNSLESDVTNLNIIEKYGRHIDNLTLCDVRTKNQLESQKSFETLFLHTHKHCTKLKSLTIRNCTLDVSDSISDDQLERQTLDYLCLTEIFVKNFTFYEKLTRLYRHIKHFKFDGLKYSNLLNENNTAFKKIYMKRTNIDHLTLSTMWYFDVQRTRILLKVATKKGSTYYIYEFDTMEDDLFKAISREKLDKERQNGSCILIAVECRSIKSLRVEHWTYDLHLEID